MLLVQVKALSRLVTCLTDIVRHSITSATSQTAAVCQLGMIGLQLLCRLLGSRQPRLFTARDGDSVSSVFLANYAVRTCGAEINKQCFSDHLFYFCCKRPHM